MPSSPLQELIARQWQPLWAKYGQGNIHEP